MPHGGFETEAEALAARAGQFDGIAERAGRIHRDLDDVLGALGACWGTDSIGRSFAAAYAAPADTALGALGALPGQLGDVRGRFADNARAYLADDEGNARTIGSADA
ncbi:hypothetical protein [Actinokineospora bangkokensis]|uniref:WXG100 family type VII secretion target n=1 Tax=Actinokineospora bangkokensis TaxID=1193682 RepID=A0A1Q9LEM0_9PSEU|nr:hypothetical protein [Actinokineospora bangkokensis]OLR90464.1 hypothetical protein BJP25_27875 [Actinokineospora bangkokensis]